MLLREIIKQLRAAPGGSDAIAITASTGIAGLNIGGSTVHSFAGIGLGKEPADKLAERIKNSLRLKQRWCNTKTLIIDEGQIHHSKLFFALNHKIVFSFDDGWHFIRQISGLYFELQDSRS